MVRSIARLAIIAAAGAAMRWMVRYLQQRKIAERRRDVKEQLKTWEEEGGNLAPPRSAQPGTH